MGALVARMLTSLCAVAAMTGCTRTERPPVPVIQIVVPAQDGAKTEWRNFANPIDIARLDRLPQEWKEGLAAIGPGQAKRTLDEQGPLLDPAAALSRPAPPPGNYSCRVWRLPAAPRRNRAVIGYKPFSCYVGERDFLLTFTKESGSDRPVGWIWPDGDSRLVFLGAMAKGAEAAPPAYGDKLDRNLVGAVERVAPFRWRLVMPRPNQESRIDVIEMIPIVPQMAQTLPS